MKCTKTFLLENNIAFEENIDLRKKTWIHRGGMASLFVTPNNVRDLKKLVQFLYHEKIDFLLIGHTSNLYILNTTQLSIVVSTTKCNKYFVGDKTIICESGTGVIRLANEMINEGVSGFEFLSGLPGTVGAALINNSSCKTNSISSLLVSAEVIMSDGSCKTLYPSDFNFEFRNSSFKSGFLKGTIITVTLKRENANPSKLKQLAAENAEERKSFLEGHAKNLGCTVNRCFSLGKMPIKYSIPNQVFSKVLQICRIKGYRRNKILTSFLCMISGCGKAAPYISSKNTIIFMWLDDGADEAFPIYLKFMRKVYKTNKLEIQII